MREWEITYDYDVTTGLKGMLVREIDPEPNRCPVCQHPLIEDWNGAHYTCQNCKQITTPCCCGASDGQSG